MRDGSFTAGMRVPPGQHSDDQAGSTERWRHLLFKMAPQCLLRGRLGPDSKVRSASAGPKAGLEGALGQHRRRGGDSRDTALAAQ